MYERGIHDAEQDDLNLFYYQHYYYYRKGYDKARKRVQRTGSSGLGAFNPKQLGIVAAVVVVAILLVAGAYYGQLLPDLTAESDANNENQYTALSTETETSTEQPSALASPQPTATTSPTNTPTPEPGLRAGVQARVVNVGEAALLARQAPDANAPVQTRLQEGTLVTILEGPVEAGGFTWWLVQDAESNGGWSAEGTPDGVVWLQPE